MDIFWNNTIIVVRSRTFDLQEDSESIQRKQAGWMTGMLQGWGCTVVPGVSLG